MSEEIIDIRKRKHIKCGGCGVFLTTDESMKHPSAYCKVAEAYPYTWRNIVRAIQDFGEAHGKQESD